MALHEYPELEQRSEKWLAARCGLVTASTVGTLIATQQPSPDEYTCSDCGSGPGAPCVSKAKKEPTPISTFHTIRKATASMQPARLVTADTDTARGLIMGLAAERITGHVEDVYVSRDMERGVFEEPYARQAYQSAFGAEVIELGFMVRDDDGYQLGFSPDGLVGSEGLIEIKSRRAKVQVHTVLAGEVPEYNMAQLQCGLLVSGRKWIDFISFSNGMHLWTHRVEPDEQWFNAIREAACAAEEQIQAIVRDYAEATANLPKTERIPDLYEIEVA